MNFTPILLILLALAQTISLGQGLVTGKVIDSETKLPINEAIVGLEGTSIQTKTNVKGYFQLNADPKTKLIIKHDEYLAGQVTVPASGPFQVELKKDAIPEFEGGEGGFMQFFLKNLTYPQVARRANTEGKFCVSFEVDSLYGVQNISIIEDIGNGCGEEVVRVLKMTSGKWKARAMSATLILPITFRTNVYLKANKIDMPKGKVLPEIVVTGIGR